MSCLIFPPLLLLTHTPLCFSYLCSLVRITFPPTPLQVAVPEHWPSEPAFVPRPGGTAEDDGLVLSLMLDGVKGVSYVLVMDAADLSTLATVDLPESLPFPSHGFFDSQGIPRNTCSHP